MKSIRHLSKLVVLLTFWAAHSASAEDIDIFLATPNVTGTRPNVLLILDNAASSNSNITLLDGSSGKKLEMLRHRHVDRLLDGEHHRPAQLSLFSGLQQCCRPPRSCWLRNA